MSDIQNKWLDRVPVKSKIERWLSSDYPNFILYVQDIQELEDITSWFENSQDNYSIGYSFLSSDNQTPSFSLMEDLVSELTEIKFHKFKGLKEKKSQKKVDLTFIQKLGYEVSSNENISFSNNSQEINIDVSKLQQYYYETEKNDFMNSLVEDFSSVTETTIIFCRLNKTKNIEFDNHFFEWFQNKFLRKLKKLSNLKICIVSNNENENLQAYINSDFQEKLNALNYDDIVNVAKDYID